MLAEWLCDFPGIRSTPIALSFSRGWWGSGPPVPPLYPHLLCFFPVVGLPSLASDKKKSSVDDVFRNCYIPVKTDEGHLSQNPYIWSNSMFCVYSDSKLFLYVQNTSSGLSMYGLIFHTARYD